jgi:23S rRNA pseudouridine1911/1915/1917 synthase
MVVAKTDAAHQELARQFHDREVEKEYVALVWGLVHAGRRIEAPIGRDTHDRQKMTTRRARRSRAAVTRVTWALHLPGVSLIRVAIHTGRTHQIRVHLSSIGHAVCGDGIYGGIPRRIAPHLKALSSLQRPFLHAERLVFTHPAERRRMEFEAPLADDLTLVLEQLDAAVVKFGYKTLQNP